MTIKFGIELEGFLTAPISGTNQVEVIVPSPKDGHPTDAFVGLLEFRSSPSYDLYSCVGEINREIHRFKDKYKLNPDFERYQHTFTRQDNLTIRARQTHLKHPLAIKNIYNKLPRHLGNKSIASCQLNFSWVTQDSYVVEGRTIQPHYGLLDVFTLIQNLDKQFKFEIQAANRQPGSYAIKDQGIRLEYRSLPNFVFFMSNFIPRVLAAVEQSL